MQNVLQVRMMQKSADITMSQRKSIKEQVQVSPVLQDPPSSHLLYHVSLTQETQTLGSVK